MTSFGGNISEKQLLVISPNWLTFGFECVCGQLCHPSPFVVTLGQHERTRAKKNGLLMGDAIGLENCLERSFKIIIKK